MLHLGLPAVLSGGVTIEKLGMSPKEMALLELSQFMESRIAVLLGVPPYLVGLPSGGDSLTYETTTALYDYHWRAGLRPFVRMVMEAISAWALPPSERLELNRDEYVRPGFAERVTAYQALHGLEDDTGRAITAQEIREGERLNGYEATAILNGGN
jgi:phage portal protein BeeE